MFHPRSSCLVSPITWAAEADFFNTRFSSIRVICGDRANAVFHHPFLQRAAFLVLCRCIHLCRWRPIAIEWMRRQDAQYANQIHLSYLLFSLSLPLDPLDRGKKVDYSIVGTQYTKQQEARKKTSCFSVRLPLLAGRSCDSNASANANIHGYMLYNKHFDSTWTDVAYRPK